MAPARLMRFASPTDGTDEVAFLSRAGCDVALQPEQEPSQMHRSSLRPAAFGALIAAAASVLACVPTAGSDGEAGTGGATGTGGRAGSGGAASAGAGGAAAGTGGAAGAATGSGGSAG